MKGSVAKTLFASADRYAYNKDIILTAKMWRAIKKKYNETPRHLRSRIFG